MAEAPVRIDLKDVSFKYPEGTDALSGIGMRITAGEFIGILGANGSGKTTLLKITDGLMKNYGGSVRLDGQEIRKLGPREIYGRMGLVFQNPDDQLFAASVFEDVAFGPRNMGFLEAAVNERVENALKAVGLEECARRSINNLSYGQKKRAAMAGLLAMGHEILLMDEPTAGLDPMGEYRMMELLTRLNRENGVTIVMATNSVELVPIFLHRLYILSRGRLKRQGSPEEVFTAPEEMESVKLRLPQIAELIWKLKNEDGAPFKKIPLTVGEARRQMLELLKNE